jgi:predicted Zn-dependent protease
MRHLISLGRNCDVAFQLRMHGEENIPHYFDWLGTPTHGLIKVIELDFDVFHPDDLAFNYDHPHPYVYDRITDIAFFHQFPLFNGQTTRDFMLFYSNFNKIFKFQARRFREYVRTLPVTLVRRDITEPEALELEKVFFERFPGTDVQFLYLVHHGEEFKTANGHARFIPGTSASLGEPSVWIKILTEEGLISTPYRHATVEILGASHDDHSLSPDDRFSEKELLMAIEGNPNHPMFPLELSRYYRKRGNFAAAELQALRSLALTPDNADSKFETIVSRWHGGKLPASEAADALIEIAKKNQLGELLRETSRALMQAGRHDEAAEYSLKAIIQNPLDNDAYHIRADNFYAKKDLAGAERAMSAAIGLQSKRQLYYHLHARYLDELGRLDDAIKAEQKALQVDPNNFQSLLHLGNLNERTGKPQEAIDCYQRALPFGGDHQETVQGWIDSLRRRVTA